MWSIKMTDRFKDWLCSLNAQNRSAVISHILLLRQAGPMLSRPYADTIKGSCYGNLKELRIQSKGEPLRAFFAFDPWRNGILLCAGSKVGNEKRFYEVMIPIAEREFLSYLQQSEKQEWKR